MMAGNGFQYGGFLQWWYPTTMGFPTKNDHFGVFWGYHHLRKHPYGHFGIYVRFLVEIPISSYGFVGSF